MFSVSSYKVKFYSERVLGNLTSLHGLHDDPKRQDGTHSYLWSTTQTDMEYTVFTPVKMSTLISFIKVRLLTHTGDEPNIISSTPLN